MHSLAKAGGSGPLKYLEHVRFPQTHNQGLRQMFLMVSWDLRARTSAFSRNAQQGLRQMFLMVSGDLRARTSAFSTNAQQGLLQMFLMMSGDLRAWHGKIAFLVT